MSDVVYSQLRDTILKNMSDDPLVPISYILPDAPDPDFTPDPKNPQPIPMIPDDGSLSKTATQLGLMGQTMIRVLPIDLRNELASQLPAGNLMFGKAENTPLLGWIIANCIVDLNGSPIFRPEDVSVIVGKYMVICTYLAWQALDANGMTVSAQTALVGN